MGVLYEILFLWRSCGIAEENDLTLNHCLPCLLGREVSQQEITKTQLMNPDESVLKERFPLFGLLEVSCCCSECQFIGNE